MIERGVILSRRGVFDIDRALFEAPPGREHRAHAPTAPSSGDARILSVGELEEFERANILRALEAAGWKVAGPEGAAALLEMNPSTLNSRMRALGIRRPPRA